jgi:hypothetical protein
MPLVLIVAGAYQMAIFPAKIAFDFRPAIIIISILFGGYYRIALILKHGFIG